MKEQEDQLHAFLQKAVAKGLTEEEIKRSLILKGWSKKFVETYCTKFFKLYKGKIRKKEQEEQKEEEKDLLEKELDTINQSIN